MVATENRNYSPLLLGRCGWELLDHVLRLKGTEQCWVVRKGLEPGCFLICETGWLTACLQSNKIPFSMNVQC